MTLFDGVYPFYPQQRKAAVFDISTITVTVVFLTLACSFLLITPGIRGRVRLYWTLRVLFSLFVGVVIVGKPVEQINETINYNEHFPWSFGADYDHSYSQGLQKGLPSPILYVAEKFSSQSPCGLHGQYRIAGHYASAMLWVAFCTWVMSNILLSMPALVYGGYMLLATGAFMIFSLLSFSTVRSSPVCLIQIGTSTLHVAYGASFWLMLAVGLLCVVAGITVVAMHHLNLDLLKTFFDLREDKAEEHQEMLQVSINPHFVNKSLSPSEPSEINSV
ncbi:dual oxidase maturation factor 2 [Geospiza fortis]|uniref:Dual oxidase maturation factor 2 n=1 Tax=Geospiza fortis TaxID=48883 RepID=A0A6I9HN93_GEOFO|nr:dual oxidase maturation factor 2 [Geospiza fortis]